VCIVEEQLVAGLDARDVKHGAGEPVGHGGHAFAFGFGEAGRRGLMIAPAAADCKRQSDIASPEATLP
jgi:hypothetical protein